MEIKKKAKYEIVLNEKEALWLIDALGKLGPAQYKELGISENGGLVITGLYSKLITALQQDDIIC